MRFNTDAYGKLFPREAAAPATPVETAVPTFTPTADIDNNIQPEELALPDPEEEGGINGSTDSDAVD